MILYADYIVLMCNNVDELAEIVNIYDQNFARIGLKIATSKTETMAFNVPEEVKVNFCWSCCTEKCVHLQISRAYDH